MGFLGGSAIKNPPANAGDIRDGFDPLVGKIPWRRERLPTPVFLPGKSRGQRSLVGHSSWGCKESDTTEQLTLLSSPATRKKAILGEIFI